MAETRRNWKENNDVPPPGSDEALEKGCKCPVMDNAHGDGHYMGGYAIVEDCPIHEFGEGDVDEQ